jgi:hypothetical protein
LEDLGPLPVALLAREDGEETTTFTMSFAPDLPRARVRGRLLDLLPAPGDSGDSIEDYLERHPRTLRHGPYTNEALQVRREDRLTRGGRLARAENPEAGQARLEKKIERERLLLGDLPELSVQILELCREHGRVTVSDAAKVTGANRNTIKDHLKALTKAGHLGRQGAGRGARYRPA